MQLSPKLAQLNYERFQSMVIPFEHGVAKPALLVFNGDVYQGMGLDTFSIDDLNYAQQKLRILSGFYGLLRPLDGILPYRLEMGTSLKVKQHKNLYEFWGDKIKKNLQRDFDMDAQQVLINLASNEYFKAVNAHQLKARIITPIFKDYKNGNYKIISFYAKKARGMMSAYILKNRIDNPEEIKLFDQDNYLYNDLLSKGDEWVFTRG